MIRGQYFLCLDLVINCWTLQESFIQCTDMLSETDVDSTSKHYTGISDVRHIIELIADMKELSWNMICGGTSGVLMYISNAMNKIFIKFNVISSVCMVYVYFRDKMFVYPFYK